MTGPDVRRALRFWDLNAALHAETRWTGGFHARNVRALAFALAWARANDAMTWPDVMHAAGWDENDRGWMHVRSAIAEDAPRFEPPNMHAREVPCEAPMIRRVGPCGKRATMHVRVTDRVTGRWRLGGWCGRHRGDYLVAVREQQRAFASKTIPTPAPNVGGLLALYHPSRSWPDWYAWAKPGWEPPALGLNPNDWPVLEEVHRYLPPALKAIDGGREEPGTFVAPPSLRLLTGDAS